MTFDRGTEALNLIIEVGFFAIFLGAFFYGIEVSLLTKSLTLVASGLAVLLARWVILRLIATPAGRAAPYA